MYLYLHRSCTEARRFSVKRYDSVNEPRFPQLQLVRRI